MLSRISVTELEDFRSCRRKWYLGKVRGLEKNIPNINLWFGQGMHKALETYYNNGKSIEKTLEVFAEWYVETETKVAEEYGYFWEDAKAEYFDLYVLGREMLENYALYDADTGEEISSTVVATEKRIEVPILDPNGDEIDATLVGVIDLISLRGDDRIQVIDHKSAKNKPKSSEALDIDNQLTGYNYLVWRLEGIIPYETIYNTLVKDIPREPKILKKGNLSTDIRQKTTKAKYLQAIEELKLDPNQYLDILHTLHMRGWTDFFSREWTVRNMEQIVAWERQLYHIFSDMRVVAENPEMAYPNPSAFRCPSCQFLPVCHAMDDGSDAEALVEAHYRARKREEIIERH